MRKCIICHITGSQMKLTKLRVVFDRSVKLYVHLTLNGVLLTFIPDDIFSILYRFRWHNMFIISDIEKNV